MWIVTVFCSKNSVLVYWMERIPLYWNHSIWGREGIVLRVFYIVYCVYCYLGVVCILYVYCVSLLSWSSVYHCYCVEIVAFGGIEQAHLQLTLSLHTSLWYGDDDPKSDLLIICWWWSTSTGGFFYYLEWCHIECDIGRPTFDPSTISFWSLQPSTHLAQPGSFSSNYLLKCTAKPINKVQDDPYWSHKYI